MEVNASKLRLGAQRLLELTANESEDNVFSQSLQKFIKKQKYVPQDVERLFRSLSEQLPLPAYTVPIAASFEEQLLLLLSMALRWDSASQRFHQYQLECVALSKLMNFSLDAQRFAKSYFHDKPAPFEKNQSNGSLPSKKSKNGNHDANLKDLELIKCCFQLLKSDTPYFRELWDWSSFIATYTHNSSSPKTQLYCNYIVAMLTNMSAPQLDALNEKISTKTRLEFDQEREQAWHTARNTLCSYTPNASDQLLNLQLQGINQSVTNIEGVLLPTFNKENLEFYASSDGCYDRIVKVDSTVVNLRSIALGVAAAKPICLSGPVGCGKTTLIEYLARKTGRICPKPNEIKSRENALKKAEEEEQLLIPKKKPKTTGNKRKLEELPLEELLDLGETTKKSGFLRIQLGDQTDSKMLLGQYRCTDVPGEFVWLPGVLTQAVMHGYWLLLEDLDAATQDTYTILSSLLERQCLSVPGFRDSVKIEPGFQLFVTVRTNKSASNSSQKSLYSLLDKYLYTINILPLSRNELCKMVSINYPKLSTVANRIVDVFLTFSSGNHTSADNLRQQESADKADNTEQYVALPFEQVSLTSSPNSGRLVSTRDLVKLCHRSNPQFSVTSSECAYFVFQNAVDVFCSYLPQSKEKITLITSIGAKLGIIRSRCEHFANEYKPDVEFGLEHIKIGRASLVAKLNLNNIENEDISEQDLKRQKLSQQTRRAIGKISNKRTTFSFTRLASCILERIAVCVTHSEPVLLVGETGVGKTSSVQYLAERTEHKLVVVNMNNQSDVSDLVGGFKPVELNYVLGPLRNEFEYLLCQTFNQEKNLQFLRLFATHYNSGRHAVIIRTMINICLQVDKNSELKANKLLPRWQTLREKLQKLQMQLDKSINISFAFIPGSLVNCISNGDWVLLDEINLASAETLECLSTILEPEGSVVLLERGDFTPVKRHPDFRIFACMNPNTDIGKKDLPVGIRNRFTELFVDELTTDADLSLLVSDYLANTGIQRKSVHSIVQLYKSLRKLSELQLNDGLGNRPVYSLRTLCRSLRICARNLCGSIERNLYESFCLSFLTQLDPDSHHVVLLLIQNTLLSNVKAILSKQLPQLGENYLDFEGYWIQPGNLEPQPCTHYILTESVKKNLKDLARIISIGKLPILLQGPTSAGKTSLIDYVARRSGNRCLRINNHEHTDLQEYIGTYAADLDGKLTFREGVLVQAMRHGFWIILDELNLASTDILEALNRVLDDNRELYIAETQTLVKAHPNFMLFATQNPPGLYGGRKTLSRAFKNRFIELHFADIPRAELETILEKRCFIPPTYARKMVQCMTQLQQHRKNTSKQVFTLRDLFRWGNRYTHADKSLHDDNRYDWNQHLVEEGYLVLSSKVRSQEEHELIEKTLFANFRKKVDLQTLFDIQTERESSSMVSRKILDAIRNFKLRDDIVWTRNMTRMAVVTAKALEFDEPVLLVGPTGCGKTTVCQLLASIANVQLRILNCHMHTEGADFLGGLRPCRGKESTQLFEWADGPLIYAMQEGSYFMADEISLAEDSVLERLNCILEPERTVLLAEKGGISELDVSPDFVVQAKSGFQFLATMNPGGDFGKKELSPALRNRFTEVWCLPSDNKEDLIEIAYNCMRRQKQHENQAINTHKVAEYLVDVVLHIRDTNDKFKFSVRDILAWANYMVSNAKLSFAEQAIFGLETIFLDALEMLPHESQEQVELLKSNIIRQAIKQASLILQERFTLEELNEKRGSEVELNECRFGIRPFFIDVNQERLTSAKEDFLFDAPTTKQNLFRLLSALSLQKPVLLEGPPGVGKTSIVESIGSAIGYQIVRINLCEHTDLADLFGTDLPAEDNLLESNTAPTERQIGSFVWRDGPLLAALKAKNTWILLDELNLAPQSVLEGLNAVLDHRGEVYIPELNKSFHLAGSTRIFACQNPLKQGGGRKGLPQSFLNRFTKVYLRKLSTEDLLHVVTEKYGKYFDQLSAHFSELLDRTPEGNLFEIYSGQSSCKSNTFDLAARLVRFSEQLDRGVASMEFGYKGGPYEFNLRDILRWCDLLHNPQTGYILGTSSPSFQTAFKDFLLTLYERMQLVYYQRMRCDQDKSYIRNVFSTVFLCDAEQLNQVSNDVALYWTADKVYLNDVVLSRKQAGVLDLVNRQEQAPLLLDSQRQQLKQIVEAVHMEKPLLLCGSTDSGKTKLIDALCVLSNRLCNTDIIDDSVTGSFQQIDLNRHLELIYKKVETLVFCCVQRAFVLHTQSEFVEQLWSNWSSYNKLAKVTSEAQQHSVLDELKLFSERLGSLGKIIEVLEGTPANCKVKALQQLAETKYKLLLLQAYIKTADSLNTGGSFEWVDSQIVTSLKCGQYILLEHVNLCSSAVLDRLNPVFEPNGSLLIAEKGISAQDSAEVVYKSTNFRAFLTVDPKNGELSRAMRNRCVELSVSRDTYSVDDLRAFVHEQGVHQMEAIDCILRVHKGLSQLTEFNNYSISHLTQFAFLSAAYKRIGYELKRAIYVAAMEVYVYSANTDLMGFGLSYYQNKLREVVLTETEVFEEGATIQEDYLSDVILNSGNLNSLTLIKLQAVALKVLLDGDPEDKIPQKQLASLFQKMENLKLDQRNPQQLIRHFLYMLYESSSFGDLQLRHLYLQPWLSKNTDFQEFSQDLYNCLQKRSNFVKGSLVDLPWNRKLIPRLRDYSTAESNSELNPLNLSALLLARLVVDIIPANSVTAVQQMNALQYSQALSKQQVTEKHANDFLTNFSSFLEVLHTSLLEDLETANLDLSQYAQLVTRFHWFNRILATGQQKLLYNNELHVPLMHKLVLHFQWLEKHLLVPLIEITAKGGCERIHTIQDRTLKIKKYIEETRRPLNVTCKIYSKQFTQFQPYYQDQQIQLHIELDELEKLLSVVPSYGNLELSSWLKRWLLLQTDDANKWRSFLRKHTNGFQLKSFEISGSLRNETLQSKLQKLQATLKEVQESSTENNMDLELDLKSLKSLLEAETAESESYIHPEGIPTNTPKLLIAALRELFMERLLAGTLRDDFDEQVNPLYADQLLTLNSNLWHCLKTLESANHTQITNAWIELKNELSELQDQAEFAVLLEKIGGSYKGLRTYQRQYRNSVQCYQLENLSTRLDCVQGPSEDGSTDISSRFSYQGPALSGVILSLICQTNGQLRSVPLSELLEWRSALQQTRHLIWENSNLLTPRYSGAVNNFLQVKENARQLLKELEYVRNSSEQEQKANQGFESCARELEKMIEKLQKEDNNIASIATAFEVSLTNALKGAIELCLLTNTPLDDPVEKNRLKNKYIAEDIDCISTLISAYDFMKIAMKYRHFGEEIYSQLEVRLRAALQRQQQLSQKLALRPEQCLYASLVQDITHFLHSNGDCESLYKLFQLINSEWENFQGPNVATKCPTKAAIEVLGKLDLWLANAQRFVHHALSRYSAYYQDFVEPIKCSVNQLRFGLESLKVIFARVQQAGSVSQAEQLQQTIGDIVQFPSKQPLVIRNSRLYGLLAELPHSEYEYFRLLKAKLSELSNYISLGRVIDEATFAAYDDALSICNQTWQQEEQRRCQLKAEAESLYVTKTKGGVDSEELIEMQEIEHNFPTNLDEDFAEFVSQPTLEQVLKLDKKASAKAKQSQIVVEEDYAFLARNFIDVMTRHTPVYYKEQPKSSKELELHLLTPYQARFQVFANLHGHYKTALGSSLEERACNGLAFGLALQQKQLRDIELEEGVSSSPYDFYKDSNISEVQSCLDVMERIEKRVMEQLELYPEHAGLADIKLVISRIRRLPAHAPVVRFNTGFQLLRQKLALWNEVAHRNNNLVSEEIEVAEFVQRWTKLELQHWRNCLGQTAAQVELQAYRYWFFIYNLLQQFIHQKQLDHSYTVLGKLSNVLLVLKHSNFEGQDKLLCVRRAIGLLPILEQYQLLADYLLLQQLATHKVSAKMLSIVLTVFVEIGSKGFCVPPDLMQDEEGQSKQESKNGEGFGLEDGTGENDASDKIESEDQLDDAKRPEDRKDEGDKQEPDCKEEKGIEMSDDFDAKMQDVEKPEEDDSGESEDEEDLNKEMGETEEGAEKLDDQIWGDDEEEKPEEEEEPDMNEEDQGKGSKDEKDAHNDLDTKNDAAKEDGKDEHEKDGLDATNEPSGEDKRKEQAKDIDDMKEPEMDEEQTNAMHNELEEPPEPEEMDLGDMNNVDEGHDDQDEQPTDENPFDIDAMKENMQPAEEPQADGDDEPDANEEGDPQSDGSDSEEDETGTEAKPAEEDQGEGEEASPEDEKDEAETQKRGELEDEDDPKTEDTPEDSKEEEQKREDKPEEHSQSKDKASKEENVQSMPETDQSSSADQVQQPQDPDIKQDQKLDEQETGEEKDGVGQAENDADDGGHQGVAETQETVSQEDRKNERQTQEKRKQGRTNEERSLGEAEQNKLKQLKTIDQLKDSKESDDAEQEKQEPMDQAEAEEYQHVKEPKNSDKTTLDNATEEQSKKIQHQEDEPSNEEEIEAENVDELMETEEPAVDPEDDAQLEQLGAEKTEQKSDKPSKTDKSKERLETPEGMEIEGEVVPTMTVPRSSETTAHSNSEILLDKSSHAEDLSSAEQIELRQQYQQQLTTFRGAQPEHEDYETWQGISNRMTQNARELCEQLRLILEPTKCTRLKGDYRTGRRINMKKIIPYIASQFRKDKIWLRRTKPAQRDYKITIAIDDSKSMHHNNSKTLTLEAISLVSQALTLLESGRLSIVSFGEAPQIILNHTEQFDGPRLVNALNFAQDKTKIAGLLNFIRTANAEESGLGGDNGLFENLLLILSDGRNIFSEGAQNVKNAIKLARLQRIFLVYIIIDNPDNKNSILDIQHVAVNADGSVNINSYLDSFPFPYYVIVRDLNQLPLVLSEAMRQWFELVNSE
ncbi:LOW QUALITY PROTEIN: uncharacterized protein Dyak_GE13493 [Drosophila yakuba]|uniref:Midasin n=1 Tax=Drosophila yakuba TaxID=7245 RepID=B4P5Z8_DROYA|nr:LOW QUALITY PROTEIN: uncharacterized protein Dyak_GE13493 [Drosophila yakuba]